MEWRMGTTQTAYDTPSSYKVGENLKQAGLSRPNQPTD